MALHAVAITKRGPWQGKQEEFDNIYYFEGPSFQLGDANYERLVKQVSDLERPLHSGEVEFISGRVWSSGGSIVENETLGLYDLDGFGTAIGGAMFGESAIMVEWECSRPNVLGRKVYLRKFIRGFATANAQTAQVYLGRVLLPDSAIPPYKAYADGVQQITTAQGVIWALCSPTGRFPRSNDNGVVDRAIRSREFRRN